MGCGNNNTQRAVAFVEKMSVFPCDTKHKGVQSTLESVFKTLASLHKIPGQLVELRKWRALTDLLANSWSERIWVVQEVVMAPDDDRGHENPIILSVENLSISFEMFATLVQKIQDDHLATEIAFDPGSKHVTDQSGQHPPVCISTRFLILVQMLFRGNESLSPGAKCDS